MPNVNDLICPPDVSGDSFPLIGANFSGCVCLTSHECSRLLCKIEVTAATIFTHKIVNSHNIFRVLHVKLSDVALDFWKSFALFEHVDRFGDELPVMFTFADVLSYVASSLSDVVQACVFAQELPRNSKARGADIQYLVVACIFLYDLLGVQLT